MSATRTERSGARAATGVANWRDTTRLAELARRHTLPAGVAVALGAILRLLWLGDTSFLGDQAELLGVARSAAAHHAFIITGFASSIGTLNPPGSTWIYAPFALLGGPLAATIFIALINIAAIALLYAIATRYLGARAGFAAALLYATASGPVRYSRFIWQPNPLAPIVLLLFGAIALAVVERRRGWLGWSLLLWGFALQLHLTATPLLGLIAVALAFTWRDLRRRDMIWAAVALVGLFGPILLWEAFSHGYDLLGLQRLGQSRPVFDTWAFTYLYELIVPAPATIFGAASPYVHIGLALEPLDVLMLALLVAAQIWLVGVLIAPWRRQRDLRSATRHALEDAHWRFALCLALWEALPLAFMLRHTRAVEPHYLLTLLPGVYLCIGGFLAWAATQLQMAVTRRSLPASQARLLAGATLTLMLIAMSAAQTVGVAGELATIHSGRFDGQALPLNYGTPLSSELDVLAVTQAAARRLHAPIAIAATITEQEPLGYLNATAPTGAAAIDYISDRCVALPAANASAPLVTLALPDTSAAQLLPHIQGAHAIRSISVQGGRPYLLYEVAPGATLTGERAIGANSDHTEQPAPVAYAYTSAGAGLALAIRWAGAPNFHQDPSHAVSYWYGADPREPPIADYTFTVQPLDAQGQPIGAPLSTTCARLGWSPDLSVVTTVALPTALQTGARVAAWRASAQMALITATRPTFGPMVFETGLVTHAQPQQLSPDVTFTAPLS